MGCDGGTIPQRKEIVKNKNKESCDRKKEIEEAERWKTCALSDGLLLKPIVSNPYGYLINKQSILEYLIEHREDKASVEHKLNSKPKVLKPIRSLKDIKNLKLTANPNAKKIEASTSGEDFLIPDFVCPITGLETNGKYKFVYSWACGCVVSERALRQVPNNDSCLVCQAPYEQNDLVVINPTTDEEFERNRANYLSRKSGTKSWNNAKEAAKPINNSEHQPHCSTDFQRKKDDSLSQYGNSQQKRFKTR